ncbi:MAG: hypothetical protein HC859_07575 [Bacteroidia bacterium]|nr:hypothetical protein [Bacteroidia bacterium]
MLPAGRNKRLRDYIIAEVGADTTDQWGFQIKLFQRAANEIYTLVSSGGEAHIYGTLNEDVASLYKAANVAILAGLVLNISFNNQPLILLYEAQPESDFMWSDLLYYDGTAYQSTTHNRIPPDK